MVDTNGFLLECEVTEAKTIDKEGAKQLLENCKEKYPTIELMWADGSYQGSEFESWLESNLKWKIEIAKKIAEKGFHLIKWRWIVERTFGWFGKWRRLSKDYELLASTSQSMLYAVSLRIMLARLVRNGLPNPELRNLPLST